MGAMRITVALLAALTAMPGVPLSPASAHDQEPRPLRRAPLYPIAPGESVGCYWERGRQYCGSFCYWEVNGRRYCQKRDHRAVPQGADIEDYILDESRSPAYRRPYGPVRRAHRRRTW